jgi:predicted CopG family antitoxin
MKDRKTINFPEVVYQKLDELKIHKNQAYYEVVDNLIKSKDKIKFGVELIVNRLSKLEDTINDVSNYKLDEDSDYIMIRVNLNEIMRLVG